jgi:hypothetical protein
VPFIFGRFDVPPVIGRPLADQSAFFKSPGLLFITGCDSDGLLVVEGTDILEKYSYFREVKHTTHMHNV